MGLNERFLSCCRSGMSPNQFSTKREERTMSRKPITEKLIRKVELKLDGKVWPLVVTHNVLIECEELTGLNLIAGDVNLRRPSAKLVRALLYVVLRRPGAKYTLEQVGDLINPENIVMVQEGLLTAWAASMPAPDDTERPTTAAA